jgi:anti-anti-sigma factor
MAVQPDLFDECRVVRADGELDLTTVPALVRGLEEARQGTARRFLIVDMRRVTFMDGSVLEPLCSAWEDCRRRLGWTRVVYTRPGLGLVLGAAGLRGRFPRYASAQDAWRGVPADRATAAARHVRGRPAPGPAPYDDRAP